MSTYAYLAYDVAGHRRRGRVEAGSIDQVKIQLWDQDLTLVDVREPALRIPPLDELFPTFVRVRRSEVILFTKQLASFVRIGMPMLDGLVVLREQASSAMMRRALDEMLTDLGAGSSLSDALSKHPRIFSRMYVDMIASSEVSGNLDDTLSQLAGYMSRDESALRKVRNAMIYPGIVIGLAIGVVSVLIGFVLPAFARLFADFRATMPLPTQVLLTVGTFCRDHTLPIFLVIGLMIGGMTLYARTERGRSTIDAVVLRLPMMGTIIRYSVVERYLRTLATLARAGVPITQMLDTAAQSVGNSTFRDGLSSVRSQMLGGEGFAGPLERCGLFPRIVIQMIRVGEETGSLDANLEEAANHYAEEVDYRLKQMVTIMEPALVIIVGGMVGFIAISVIAPMYSLVHAIH